MAEINQELIEQLNIHMPVQNGYKVLFDSKKNSVIVEGVKVGLTESSFNKAIGTAAQTTLSYLLQVSKNILELATGEPMGMEDEGAVDPSNEDIGRDNLHSELDDALDEVFAEGRTVTGVKLTIEAAYLDPSDEGSLHVKMTDEAWVKDLSPDLMKTLRSILE